MRNIGRITAALLTACLLSLAGLSASGVAMAIPAGCATLSSRIDIHKTATQQYNNEVAALNSAGGGTQSQVDYYNTWKTNLENEEDSLNREGAYCEASSATASKISQQRQARHVKGAKLYNGGGYFNSYNDAQAVLDAFHSGAAEYLGKTRSGNPVIRYNGVTGYNNNAGAGVHDQATDVYMIKGTSTVSVVPLQPNWSP